MKNLDLNAMGVTEMSAKEVLSIDGGQINPDTSRADAISAILALYSAGLISLEEGEGAMGNL